MLALMAISVASAERSLTLEGAIIHAKGVIVSISVTTH
jgi:hypothetical protein